MSNTVKLLCNNPVTVICGDEAVFVICLKRMLSLTVKFLLFKHIYRLLFYLGYITSKHELQLNSSN